MFKRSPHTSERCTSRMPVAWDKEEPTALCVPISTRPGLLHWISLIPRDYNQAPEATFRYTWWMWRRWSFFNATFDSIHKKNDSLPLFHSFTFSELSFRPCIKDTFWNPSNRLCFITHDSKETFKPPLDASHHEPESGDAVSTWVQKTAGLQILKKKKKNSRKNFPNASQTGEVTYSKN